MPRFSRDQVKLGHYQQLYTSAIAAESSAATALRLAKLPFGRRVSTSERSWERRRSSGPDAPQGDS